MFQILRNGNSVSCENVAKFKNLISDIIHDGTKSEDDRVYYTIGSRGLQSIADVNYRTYPDDIFATKNAFDMTTNDTDECIYCSPEAINASILAYVGITLTHKRYYAENPFGSVECATNDNVLISFKLQNICGFSGDTVSVKVSFGKILGIICKYVLPDMSSEDIFETCREICGDAFTTQYVELVERLPRMEITYSRIPLKPYWSVHAPVAPPAVAAQPPAIKSSGSVQVGKSAAHANSQSAINATSVTMTSASINQSPDDAMMRLSKLPWNTEMLRRVVNDEISAEWRTGDRLTPKNIDTYMHTKAYVTHREKIATMGSLKMILLEQLLNLDVEPVDASTDSNTCGSGNITVMLGMSSFDINHHTYSEMTGKSTSQTVSNVIMLAGQFNGLESTDDEYMPLYNYPRDRTQGPQASIAIMDLAIYRDIHLRDDQQELLSNIGGTVGDDCYQNSKTDDESDRSRNFYKNGYFTPWGLNLRTQIRVAREILTNVGKLKILVAEGIPNDFTVSAIKAMKSGNDNSGKSDNAINDTNNAHSGAIYPSVTHVVCAAPSLQDYDGYAMSPLESVLCDGIICRQYDAIANVAIHKSQVLGMKVACHLTLLGMGAFGMPPTIVVPAMTRAIDKCVKYGVDVIVHCYSPSDLGVFDKHFTYDAKRPIPTYRLVANDNIVDYQRPHS